MERGTRVTSFIYTALADAFSYLCSFAKTVSLECGREMQARAPNPQSHVRPQRLPGKSPFCGNQFQCDMSIPVSAEHRGLPVAGPGGRYPVE